MISSCLGVFVLLHPFGERTKTPSGGKPHRTAGGGLLIWSGKAPPPAIGSDIQVRINGIGKCQVAAYASYGGYLGVMAWPYSPPEWWVNQNGTPGPDNAGLVFGAEISAKEA